MKNTQNKKKYSEKTENMKRLCIDRNIKYRRKKNFIKKGYQLSQICGFDVIIFTFDTKQNKLNQFYTSPDFQFDRVNQMILEETSKYQVVDAGTLFAR